MIYGIIKTFTIYINLHLARARADWFIGMNLSRAYTLSERYKGNKVTLPIGRVKTPTLALWFVESEN